MDVRRGVDRFRTVAPGLDSRHSFSYGSHYDPDNLGFGVLMAHNEDRLGPGAGFDRHLHRGLDIVTWVLSGTLEHQHWITAEQAGHEPTAGRERLGAGMAQVLRTGSGVHHAEHAAAGSEGVHYVQMWLASATPAADPRYARRDFTAALAEAAGAGSPGAVAVASGRPGRRFRRGSGANMVAGRPPVHPIRSGTVASGGRTGEAPLGLSQPAELSVARLPAGAEIQLPSGPLVHVFVASGVASVDGTQLAAGDALRLRAEPATPLVAVELSEVLLWSLP